MPRKPPTETTAPTIFPPSSKRRSLILPMSSSWGFFTEAPMISSARICPASCLTIKGPPAPAVVVAPVVPVVAAPVVLVVVSVPVFMSVVAAGLSAPIAAGLSASIAAGLSGDAAGGVVCAITGAARNIAMALLSRRFLVIWLSSSSLSGIQQQGPQRVPPNRRPDRKFFRDMELLLDPFRHTALRPVLVRHQARLHRDCRSNRVSATDRKVRV